MTSNNTIDEFILKLNGEIVGRERHRMMHPDDFIVEQIVVYDENNKDSIFWENVTVDKPGLEYDEKIHTGCRIDVAP